MAFLLIPARGDRDAVALRRKVVLLAARTLSREPRLQPWLSRMLTEAPEETLRAIGAPDVLPFLLSIESGAIPFDEGMRNAVPSLLAMLHFEALVWSAPFERIVCDAKLHAFSPPARSIATDGARVSIETHSGSIADLESLSAQPAWLSIDDVQLALVDTNPLSAIEAHPDKSGNALSFGDRDPSEWISAFRDAFAIIGAALPEWLEESKSILQRIVPVGYEPERHLSASYREAPGIMYASLHPDPLTLAEAIIHETQHTKINLLSWLDPVLHNAFTTWTDSPVRPDLRPLMGVLMAVHAFVPVAELHRRLAELDHPIARSERFRTRRDEVRAMNAQGLDVLRAKGELTRAGERLMRDLAELSAQASG